MQLDRVECQEIKTDILVIGSEAAGAKAAIEIKDAGGDVLVVTKGLAGRTGNTIMAGGGIQAPFGHMDPRDNPDVFFEDVIKGGDYLNNQKLVEKLVNLACSEISKMEKWGARFRKQGDKFQQVQYPGSTYPRALKPVGFHGGLQWRAAFYKQFKRQNTKIMEDIFITKLLLSGGQVAGAFGFSLRTGLPIIFRAKVTILATGGCCQIYRQTDSSIDATGDGIVIAYNEGAEVTDMEFQQFFPLCCYTPPFEWGQFPGQLRYRLHGKFYNSLGEAFMERYYPDVKDWALRDPTSRAIYQENLLGRGSPHGGAYLSFRHLPENLIDDYIRRDKPPFIFDLEKAGIDIRKHAIEVGPGAHYTMGGLRINENCETNLPRLYAIGEVAAGMDGAERIDGGPAITWCLTMGYLVTKEAIDSAKNYDWLNIDKEQVNEEFKRSSAIWERKEGVKGFEVKNKIKDAMWNNCSLIREKNSMQKALDLILKIKTDDLPRLCSPGPSRVFNKGWMEALEAINLVYCSEMVVRAALLREESRKSHYRTDFLKRDNRKWLKNIIIHKDKDNMELTTASPIMTRMKPPDEEVK